MPHRVLCCSLFPALQRTLTFDTFATGRVNRVRQVTESVGGKAVNTARTLRTLGADPLLVGFSGGTSGHRIEALLASEGLAHAFTPTVAPTRICQTLLADNMTDFTELAESGTPPTPDAFNALRATVHAELTRSEAMILSGTLPSGQAPSSYAALLPPNLARPLLLDTAGPALLAALDQAPATVKVNAGELRATIPDAPSLETAAHRLLKAGAQQVGITQGPDTAWLFTPSATFRFEIPAVAVVSALGSGDAVNAGFILGLLRGDSPADAFALGLACGTTNAMQPTPGTVDQETVVALRERIRAFPIP